MDPRRGLEVFMSTYFLSKQMILFFTLMVIVSVLGGCYHEGGGAGHGCGWRGQGQLESAGRAAEEDASGLLQQMDHYADVYSHCYFEEGYLFAAGGAHRVSASGCFLSDELPGLAHC